LLFSKDLPFWLRFLYKNMHKQSRRYTVAQRINAAFPSMKDKALNPKIRQAIWNG
jgi:hypothetical protein